MLRKISYILFALFLLVSFTGISVSMHYCGGKYIYTSINKEAKSCCDGNGGCCENKTIHIEVKEDFVGPVQTLKTYDVEMDVLFPILFAFNFELLAEEFERFEVFIDTSPPQSIQTRLSLLQTYHC